MLHDCSRSFLLRPEFTLRSPPLFLFPNPYPGTNPEARLVPSVRVFLQRFVISETGTSPLVNVFEDHTAQLREPRRQGRGSHFRVPIAHPPAAHVEQPERAALLNLQRRSEECRYGRTSEQGGSYPGRWRC